VNDVVALQGNAQGAVINNETVAAAMAQSVDGRAGALTDGQDYFVFTEGNGFAAIQGGRAIAGSGSKVFVSEPIRSQTPYSALPSPRYSYSEPSNQVSTWNSGTNSSYTPNISYTYSTRAELASNSRRSTNNSFVSTRGRASAVISDGSAVVRSGEYSGSYSSRRVWNFPTRPLIVKTILMNHSCHRMLRSTELEVLQ
jgi:hypothetical protein